MKKKLIINLTKDRKQLVKLFFFIATLVVMMGVTIKIAWPCFTVIRTQFKILYLNNEIGNLGLEWEYNDCYANSLQDPVGVAVYRKNADEALGKIPEIESEIENLVNSKNKLVAYAAKKVSVPFLSVFFIPIILIFGIWWYFLHKNHYEKIIKYELLVLKFFVIIIGKIFWGIVMGLDFIYNLLDV